MAKPIPFIWSFGRGLRKGEEKDWIHDWAEQISVRTRADDNASIVSFVTSFCDDSDASSECTEIIYESEWEPEEESSVTGLSEIPTTIDLHQELSGQCEAVVAHEDTLPEKELSISQVSTEIEFLREQSSQRGALLPPRGRVAAMIEFHQQPSSKCEAASMQKADLPEEKVSSRFSLPPRGRVAAMIELHQQSSSKCEAVSMQKTNLPEEELSSRISTVMELHQDSSTVCEALLPCKDDLNNETQPVEHLRAALADSLCELQAAKDTNESLQHDYQELLKEHRNLKDKHDMLGGRNYILKKAHRCYDSLRALAMEAYDSMNSKHQTLMNEHIDLSKGHEALKHRTNQESLLGLQTTEGNLFEVLAQQIY